MGADDEATAEQLRKTSAALLEANEKLARIPLLEARADEVWEAREWFAGRAAELEAENDRLRAERDALRGDIARLAASESRAWDRVSAVEGSTSWRLLAPLRRLRARAR